MTDINKSCATQAKEDCTHLMQNGVYPPVYIDCMNEFTEICMDKKIGTTKVAVDLALDAANKAGATAKIAETTAYLAKDKVNKVDPIFMIKDPTDIEPKKATQNLLSGTSYGAIQIEDLTTANGILKMVAAGLGVVAGVLAITTGVVIYKLHKTRQEKARLELKEARSNMIGALRDTIQNNCNTLIFNPVDAKKVALKGKKKDIFMAKAIADIKLNHDNLYESLKYLNPKLKIEGVESNKAYKELLANYDTASSLQATQRSMTPSLQATQRSMTSSFQATQRSMTSSFQSTDPKANSTQFTESVHQDKLSTSRTNAMDTVDHL